MKTICEYLAQEHLRCDRLFAKVESCIAQRDWRNADQHFRLFEDAMGRHIVMEESILFPAFINAVSGASAPIAMLRTEHQRLKAIFERFEDSLQRQDLRDFALHADSYVLLVRQHSMKEEEMLYPLLDRILADSRERIVDAMCASMSNRQGLPARTMHS